MNDAVFPLESREAFAAVYPGAPGKLRHTLRDHPLLTLKALAFLAKILPADSIEYNPGALPIGIKPEDIPKSQLGVVETIRKIGHSDSWVVLKRIEQVAAYHDLLHSVLGELKDIIGPRTGKMLQLEGFVFISSPHAVTPFHFDPEHNILMQLHGQKVMTVFPIEDEQILDARAHELFHLGKHHRNLPWQDEFAAKGCEIQLRPGDALHVPVKAPHWVKNGAEPSISLSVTWRSNWSYNEADARAFNHALRLIGFAPASPGPYPARSTAKALAWRAIRKLRGAA